MSPNRNLDFRQRFDALVGRRQEATQAAQTGQPPVTNNPPRRRRLRGAGGYAAGAMGGI